MNEAKLRPLLILVATMLPVLGALLVFSTLLWGSPNEAAALAVNRYVATDGNDVGPCSDSASPCRTVQYAVDQAASGDSVLVATGVYTDVQSRGGINQTVYLSKSLTLRGGYAEVDWLVSNPISFPTRLDAQGRGRVIAILGNITTTIENLIVTGGNANGLLGLPGSDVGAGIYASGASVTISNTKIISNSISSSSSGKGVGAFVYQGSASLISNTISNNRQYLGGEGGGLALWESQATLVQNTISGNRSDYTYGSSTSGNAGGVFIVRGRALLDGNVIGGNTSNYGGGIYLNSYNAPGVFTLTNNTIISNTSTWAGQGGGIYHHSGTLTLLGNTIRGNGANNGAGGGASLSTGAVLLQDNEISGNWAHSGGGVYGGANKAVGNRVFNNTATWNGFSDAVGGGFYWGGDGILASNVFTNNQAAVGGGVYATGNLSFTNNVFAFNGASSGAGMFIEGRGWNRVESRLIQNTFSRNSGPGLSVSSNSGWYTPMSVYLTNTLVASNTTGIVSSNTSVSTEGTLWFGNGANTSGSVVTGTVNVFGNPVLAADGYHLQAGSGAVDAGIGMSLGSGATPDFEGDPRPAGYGFDLGADELKGTALQMTKQPSSPIMSPGDTISYSMAITVAGGMANNLVITDTLPTQLQAQIVQSSAGSADVLPGWGGGAVVAAGTVLTGSTVYVTVTAQVTTNSPPPAQLPVALRNTLTARSNEAGYQVFADSSFQYCLAKINDAPTLFRSVQAGIDAAATGDVVKVAGICQGVNYRSSEQAYITKTITLRGGYSQDDWSSSDPAANPTILDAQRKGRVIMVSGQSITPTIEGLRIVSGSAVGRKGGPFVNDDAGGGIYVSNAAAILRNNLVENSVAGWNASANAFNGYGGGIYLNGAGKAQIISNTVRSNEAYYGAGIALYQSAATVSSNVVRSNRSSGPSGVMGGGGMYLGLSGATVVSNTVQENRTGSHGGGMFLDGSNATVSGNTILSNTATASGGGAYTFGLARFSGNTIQGNTGNAGGGLYFTNGSATVTGNTISSNTATGGGGGVYFNGGSPELSGNLILNNVASVYNGGGGLYVYGGNAAIKGNVIKGNAETGGYGGGGLFIGSGASVLQNNAIVDNSSTSRGSGIAVDSYSANPVMANNTVARNFGGDGSGIYLNASAAVLSNTIIFSHTVGIKQYSGAVTLNRTLWDGNGTKYTGSVSDNDFVDGTAALDADGYHLTAGSLAIDAGLSTNLDADIDGQPRPMGPAPDIGADEYAYFADFALAKTRQGGGPVNSGSPITYTLTVTSGGPTSPVTGRVVDTLSPSAAVAGLSASTPGGDCARSSAVITCTVYNVTTDTLRLVTVVVTPTSTFNGVLTNTAIVVPSAVDADLSNNTAGPVTTTVVYVVPAPDLRVDKSGPSLARPGQIITYALSWSNQGTETATNVVLTDVLPTAVTNVSATGSFNLSGGNLTWSLGPAAPGVSGVQRITATVNTGLPDGTVLTNTARITGTIAGDPLGDNTSTVTTTVFIRTADLLADKRVDKDEAVVGDLLYYSIYISNTGRVPIQPELVDLIPLGTEFAPGILSPYASRGTAEYRGFLNAVAWSDTAPLQPGDDVEIDFSAMILSPDGYACGLVRNYASVSEAGYPYLDHQVWADTLVKAPDLGVRVDSPRNVALHTTYTATVGYRNTQHDDLWGDHSRAADARVIVDFPAGVTPLSAVPPATTKPRSDRWVWDGGRLNPGDSGQFQVLLQADDYRAEGYTVQATIEGTPSEECSSQQADNQDQEVTYPVTLDFQKHAGTEKWILRWSDTLRSWQTYFGQDYVLDYDYRNGDPLRPDIVNRFILDDLPFLMLLDRETSQPQMRFGGFLTSNEWSSQKPFHVGDKGWVRFSATGLGVEPLVPLTNTAEMRATLANGSGFSEQDHAVSVPPLFAPYLTSPENGDICDCDVFVRGLATPFTAVSLFISGLGMAGSTVSDGEGVFTATLGWDLFPKDLPVTITATASVTPAFSSRIDSEPSKAVQITLRTDLQWDPMRSFWTGEAKAGPLKGEQLTFRFRDSKGRFSTTNWEMPGVYGFWDTDLYILGCGCDDPDTTQIITVTADGNQYSPVSRDGNWFIFRIGGAHQVKIVSACDQDIDESNGQVLIDPDGYVFDVSGGISNTLQGVTVTAMVSMPQWGGWVPWPAHMYENQVNPQVTGPDGYFAFFTPPGQYYLQVEGKPGYQSWRSPVVEVITQIVHVNVPYTPLSSGNIYTVTLTPDGIVPPVITVPMTSTIAWVSTLGNTATVSDVIRFSENPVLHPLSALNPLSNTLGFDGGLLEPGRVYRRQFGPAGSYSYTDGAGNSGTVVVQAPPVFKVYLPVVARNFDGGGE